jgi:hypothetical protein
VLPPARASLTALLAIAFAAISMAAGFVLIRNVAPTYETDQTLIFLVPGAESSNPFSYFPKAVITTAQAVVYGAGQESTRQRLAGLGANPDYTVQVQDDGNQWVSIQDRPNVFVTAQDGDPSRAQFTTELVAREVASQLASRQRASGAAADTWIRTQELTPNAGVSKLPTSRSRALAACSVISIWLSALAARLLAARWRRRRPDPLQDDLPTPRPGPSPEGPTITETDHPSPTDRRSVGV